MYSDSHNIRKNKNILNKKIRKKLRKTVIRMDDSTPQLTMDQNTSTGVPTLTI